MCICIYMGDKEREERSERRRTETHEVCTVFYYKRIGTREIFRLVPEHGAVIDTVIERGVDLSLSLSLSLSLGANPSLSLTLSLGADLSLSITLSHGAGRAKCGTPHLARPIPP